MKHCENNLDIMYKFCNFDNLMRIENKIVEVIDRQNHIMVRRIQKVNYNNGEPIIIFACIDINSKPIPFYIENTDSDTKVFYNKYKNLKIILT